MVAMPSFVDRPTIRFFEADQQRVVYHMWYLAYFEDARNAMLAERGASLRSLHADGLDLQIVHYELDWLGPVRYEDALAVVVEVATIGTTSFTLSYTAVVGEAPAVTGRAVYVVVRRGEGQTVPVPEALRAALRAGEAA
jgi:acyl-CoA thioester hydrolase